MKTKIIRKILFSLGLAVVLGSAITQVYYGRTANVSNQLEMTQSASRVAANK